MSSHDFSPKKGGKGTHDDPEAEIIAHAWKEPGFKQKLLQNPREALSGMGFEIPEDIQFQIIEESSRTWTLVIPSCPKDISHLKEEELLELATLEAHPLHRFESKQSLEEENLWELFSHRFWPSHHEEN